MYKQILQILTSVAFGICIYFGYKNLITGMNPMMMLLFGILLLFLLTLNILLIRKNNKKVYSFVIFFILGMAFPLYLSAKWRNQINIETPRKEILSDE